MVALDGGVVETPPELPIERRLERIHARARRADRLARAGGDGARGRLLRQERALGDGRRPGQRRRDAGRRPARHRAASPTRRRRSRWPSAAPARAGKEQVQRMVGTLLGLPEPPTPDHAADALAVAICHGGGAGRGAAIEAAESAAQRAGRMIAAVRGEVMVRRPDHVVIDAGGVGYRLAVSSETLKAVPATGREAFLHAELIVARRLAGALRLRLRGGARPLRRADLGQRGRAQGRDRGALRRPRARAAAGDRRRRRQTLPGRARDRQADRGADHRRAAREGRRRARGGGRSAAASRAATPRGLARDGLVNLGYAPLEAEQLLDGIEGGDPEELIAAALRKAGTSRSKA